MSSKIKWSLIPMLVAPPALITSGAYAVTYLNEEQAQKAIFGDIKMEKNFIKISDEMAKEIKQKSGMDVRYKEIKIWNTADGGKFFVDEVIGKHEYITYAIGINKDGTVRGIEIMNYNETYGYEIRNPEWREQFIGKNNSANLTLGGDIKNISGATLSCKHITDGVRRILVTYNLIFRK